MAKRVLVATAKPFASQAVVEIKNICEKRGYELILNEKYTEQSDLVNAVKDVDALIVRSDKVTSEIVVTCPHQEKFQDHVLPESLTE